MSTPLLFAAVILYLVTSAVIAHFSKILHLRLRAPKTKIAIPDQLPPKLVAAFGEYANSYLPDNFQFSHFMRQEALENSIPTPDWLAVYSNSSENTYAEVFLNVNPNKTQPFKVTFVTVYEDLRVMTLEATESVLGDVDGRNEIHRSQYPGISAQWEQHLAQISKTEETRFQTQDRMVSDMCAYTERRNNDLLQHIEDITQHDYLVEHPNGLRISFKALRRMLFCKNHKTVKSQKDMHEDPQPKIESEELISAEHYSLIETLAFNRRQQVDENTLISSKFKIAAFFLSGIVCALFLGYLFSWHILLFLFPVLFLHELGHLVAMMAFGYKRKYMLFMPLGAFVIGEKKYAPTWQKMTVFLAGPVPGILLALGLLSFLPEIGDHTQSFITMLLIINCFNLLPVMPLDGGQMVNLAISHRYPRLQFVLHLISLALTLLPALLFQDPILLVLATWLLIAVPSSYRRIAMFRSMQEHHNTAKKSSLVEHLFTTISNQKANFGARYEEIKYTISCSQTTRSSGNSSFVFGLYALALIGPLAFLVTNTNDSMTKLILGGESYALNTDSNSSFSAEEHKKHIMDSDVSVDEKIEALEFATYAFDSFETEKSIDYLELALSLTDDSSEPDYYKEVLYSNLHGQFLTLDNLEDAENIRRISVERSIENSDFTSAATNLYRDLYHHNTWNKSTEQKEIISEQKMDAILQEISSKQVINPKIEIAKAFVYSARAYEHDLHIDQQIELVEDAMTLYRKYNDIYGEQESVISLAQLYHESSKQTQAISLLKYHLLKPVYDDYSKIAVYRQLVDLYLANADFDMAENTLQKANTIIEKEDFSYVTDDLAWINVFSSKLDRAQQQFTDNIEERTAQFENRYDEFDFIMKVALKAVDSEEENSDPLARIPFLVIAHAQRNADLAKNLHAQIQSDWQKNLPDNYQSTLVEYYKSMESTSPMYGSLEARKHALIMGALEYVETEISIQK